MTDPTPIELLSSVCARAADGKISIALFDGPDEAVGLLSCSEETALNIEWQQQEPWQALERQAGPRPLHGYTPSPMIELCEQLTVAQGMAAA